jgi:D-alanine transfer protein
MIIAMPRAHLPAALCALLIMATLLAGGQIYAEQLENRYAHTLAYAALSQKAIGSAVQRAAFRQPDLLPIYGSSELSLQKWYQDPYRAQTLFRNEPTGFDVFPLGEGDTTDIVLLQRLAAVGPELCGKKVVISLSPTWFFERKQEPARSYAAHFSRLQAGATIFSTNLSYALKRDIARRLMDYPDTLGKDPLLRFGAEQLVSSSLAGRALYTLALPLGQLYNLVLRLQDHWEMLTYIWAHPDIQPAPAAAAPPDWPALLAAGRRASLQYTDNNPYGFDNTDWRAWSQQYMADKRNQLSDVWFRRGLKGAAEWHDLDLLLRTLHELGARPLILSMPIGGRYYDHRGVSAQARAVYYQELRALAARYGDAERDFAEHDEDPYFVLNARGHLLPEGWIYYDQALDRFYHDQALE